MDFLLEKSGVKIVSVAGFEELRLQVIEWWILQEQELVSVAGFEELRLQVEPTKAEPRARDSFSCWV